MAHRRRTPFEARPDVRGGFPAHYRRRNFGETSGLCIGSHEGSKASHGRPVARPRGVVVSTGARRHDRAIGGLAILLDTLDRIHQPPLIKGF